MTHDEILYMKRGDVSCVCRAIFASQRSAVRGAVG